MDNLNFLFAALVIIGFILIAAEVFIPGGIVGALGFLCIIGAIVVGFKAFGKQNGLMVMAILLISSTGFLVAWLYLLPRTTIGKSVTLSDDTHEYKSAPDRSNLLDQEGEAVSNLGPSGVAQINNRREDVTAESSWIPSGSRIKVIKITGNRVIVRQITS